MSLLDIVAVPDPDVRVLVLGGCGARRSPPGRSRWSATRRSPAGGNGTGGSHS